MPAARAEARRRRRVKVFGQTFFKKFAVGKAEPYGLKSNAKRCKRKTRETGGPGPQWGPFRTGLRCHFGRCWASATGRQHPRRQPRNSSAFPGRQDSPLRREKPIKQEAQERPGLLFFPFSVRGFSQRPPGFGWGWSASPGRGSGARWRPGRSRCPPRPPGRRRPPQ